MGAGIFVNGSISLNVEGCRIINNQATSGVGGGVICFGAGIHSFNNSEISNNSATAYGGGVHLNEGEITFTNVTFSHNTAGSGGSSFTMDSSGTAHFVNCTLAVNNGPGSTISNYDGVLTFANTILADNSGNNCGGSGPWTSQGYNISDDSSCAFAAAGDSQDTDPLLSLLELNGASTKTHALQAGSPAIDAGNNAVCPATDQRKLHRPQDGNKDGNAICDIGAYELKTAFPWPMFLPTIISEVGRR